jgi:homocysteine S-methyltransferase
VIIIETFTDTNELKLALRAARDNTDLPVICQLTFLENMKTPLGIEIEEAIKAIEAETPDVIGINCGVGPLGTLKSMQRVSKLTNILLSCFPNAGLPEYIDGRFIYLTTPEYFANIAYAIVNEGVNLIGGCCGTNPLHIRALSLRLKDVRPSRRIISISKVKPPEEIKAPIKRPTFLDKIAKQVVVAVELDPPRTLDYEKMTKKANQLNESGVDVITLGDNPLAIVRISNLAIAHLIEREGIQTIIHLACRDRNLIGLQSILMGAHVFGITGILAVTGDPSRIGDQPTATSVYDLNSFELIRLIQRMNSGIDYHGNPLKGRTNFVTGCAFNPNKEGDINRLVRKVNMGAQFALSQPCYDKKQIEKIYLELKKKLPGFPVFFGIMPPLSARNAEFLANEVPGITIPEQIIERLRSLPKEKQAMEGIIISKELAEFASMFTNCFYIVLPFERVEIGCEFASYVKSKYSK